MKIQSSFFSRVASLLLFCTVSSPIWAQEDGAISDVKSFGGRAHFLELNQKAARYSLKAQYPQFTMATPLTRLANSDLKSSAINRFNTFLKRAKEETKNDQPIAPYEYSEGEALTFFSPKLISVAISNYSYNGGAHGFGYTEARNYGMAPRQIAPRKLAFKDFFQTGFNAKPRVQSLIFAKLRANKEQDATWIIDGSVKKMEPEQFENFTVSSKGLTWYFAPYAVGPFASGLFEVTLSPRELGPKFRDSMVR